MKTKSKSSQAPAGDDPRQMEAAKTNRLRALRLAKEAAEKDEAAREAAAKPVKPAKRRARATPNGDQPGDQPVAALDLSTP